MGLLLSLRRTYVMKPSHTTHRRNERHKRLNLVASVVQAAHDSAPHFSVVDKQSSAAATAMQAAQDSAPQSATEDKQRAARLRMGAHLALALCYLPVEVPGPQDILHIRSQEEVDEDTDPEGQDLNKSDDLPLQVRWPLWLMRNL